MPNWVRNEMMLVGSEADINSAVELLRGKTKDTENEGEALDFNNVVEMPAELLEVSSPVSFVTQKEYDKELKEIQNMPADDPRREYMRHPRGITKKMYKELVKKYGCGDWYDWACRNWGTKWNASNSEVVMGKDEKGMTTATYFFETAWSCPESFILKLSKKFPDVEIRGRFADEDLGANVGEYVIVSGVYDSTNIPNMGSNEAMEMAINIWGYEDEFVLVDGEYKWKDEIDDDEE